MNENTPSYINPFAQSKYSKNPPIDNQNYTNQEFWSLRARLVQFLQERFGSEGTVLPNTFNDFSEGSIAVMLIEMNAFIADLLSFKMDQQFGEIYIDSVTELENAFRLAKLVGYQPTPPIASRSLWAATLNSVQDQDVTIISGLPIDITVDEGPITIELYPADSSNNPIFDRDIVIPAGSSENTSIVGLEGKTRVDDFSANGETYQSYELANSPVIYDSIRLRVDGIIWNKVDFFSESSPRKEYMVEFDSEYSAFVKFGNNKGGMIPSSGSQISIEYRIGGGIRGNIVSGYIETQRQANVTGLEFSIPVTLRNYTKGEYGYDGDTIETIKRQIPVYLKTQDRAVTGEDFEILADQFVTPYHGQIGKSTATLRHHGCAANIIDLYVLAKQENGVLAKASDDLKTKLYDYIDEHKMLNQTICIKDGEILEVDIFVEAITDIFYRKFEPEIREQILRRVDSFFDINNWNYGQNLKSSELIKALSDLVRVQDFDLSFVTNDDSNSGDYVSSKFNQIIRPGSLTISLTYK